MSNLEELIERLCPDGVEYKTLTELFDTKNGYTPSKSKEEYWTNGTVPWFRMEDIRENGNILSKAIQYVSESAIKGSLFPADSIIVATSATIGQHALIKVPSLANQRFTYLVLKDEFKEQIDIMFIYYCCFKLDEYCKECLNQGNFASVDMKKFLKFKFPVPPLEVQREIVRILDNFTFLTAELAARQKQYEYYKEYLFENHIFDVEWKRLDELFPFIRNGFVGTIKSFFTNETDGIRYLEGTNIHDGVISDNEVLYVTKEFHKKHIKNQLKADDILMVQSGHIGECAVVGKKYEGSNCHALIIMSNGGKCLSKYYVYYFHTIKGFKSLTPAITGGTIKHVLAGKIGKIKVPVPSLEQQQRIVDILDRFDTLCNDISSGLPAEIEMRQKQYEYYRDKLLTFKELKKEA
mgnify:CR=1 FL=1